MRGRALFLLVLAWAGGCSGSDPGTALGGQSGGEHTTPGPACPDSGPAYQCCGGDAGTTCVCSRACSVDADCTDPGRPRCAVIPSTGNRLCVPAGFQCR
jgi:hypothetical protein